MCGCKNVGTADRIVRAVVGIMALAIAFARLGALDANAFGIVAAVASTVMLLTALFGMCPLYIPLKLSTCKIAPR